MAAETKRECCIVCTEDLPTGAFLECPSSSCKLRACRSCWTDFWFVKAEKHQLPRCMNVDRCPIQFQPSFLQQHFGDSWMRSTWKKLCAPTAIFVQRQLALEHQNAAEQFRKVRMQLEEHRSELANAHAAFASQQEHDDQYEAALQQIETAQALVEGSEKQMAKLLKEAREKVARDAAEAIHRQAIQRQQQQHDHPDDEEDVKMESSESKEREVIRLPAGAFKCSTDGCRGFRIPGHNDRSTCGMCKRQSCRQCNVDLPASVGLNGSAGPKHVCDPEAKSSWEAIRAWVKPCPACGIMIQKDGGCDQMLCTNPDCGFTFEWSTGKAVTEYFHNPLLANFLRHHGSRAKNMVLNNQERHVHSISNGGILSYFQVTRWDSLLEAANEMVDPAEFMRYYHPHMSMVCSHIRFMAQDMTEEEWKRQVKGYFTKQMRYREVKELYNGFHLGVTNLLLNWQNQVACRASTSDLQQLSQEIEAGIREMVTILQQELKRMHCASTATYYVITDGGDPHSTFFIKPVFSNTTKSRKRKLRRLLSFDPDESSSSSCSSSSSSSSSSPDSESSPRARKVRKIVYT